MKKSSIYLSVFIAFLLAVPQEIQAQVNVKKAKKILNQVTKNYKKLKSFKSGFTITIDDKGKKTTQSGTVYSKKEMFKVELKSEDIVCNGTTLWNWQKEINEIQINHYKPSANDINPSNIFTSYDVGFDAVWVSTLTENGVVLEEIDLVPKDKNKDFSKIKLKINTKTDEIVSAWIRKKNGLTTTYSINNFVDNPNLADSFFVLDVNALVKKGAEVVDLR